MNVCYHNHKRNVLFVLFRYNIMTLAESETVVLFGVLEQGQDVGDDTSCFEDELLLAACIESLKAFTDIILVGEYAKICHLREMRCIH